MTAFRNLASKYIFYQGLQGQSIVPINNRQVYARTRDIHGGQKKANEWLRCLEVLGVSHVSGGVGADALPALGALENWATNNVAPDALIGQEVLADGTVALEVPDH
jgi:hypothetical protein